MPRYVPWNDVIDVWQSGQTLLPRVVRWKKYLGDLACRFYETMLAALEVLDLKEPARVQNTLEHTHGLLFLIEYLLLKLAPYVELDAKLLLTCGHSHDHGEGELKRDICGHIKQNVNNLAEYQAFVERHKHLPAPVFAYLERAFLLQFAGECPDIFPEHAREVMRELQRTHPHEIVAFQALEKWDYLLYVLEQYRDRDNVGLLAYILHCQLADMDRLADMLPGFRQEIWTDENRAWCYDFMNRNLSDPQAQRWLTADASR